MTDALPTLPSSATPPPPLRSLTANSLPRTRGPCSRPGRLIPLGRFLARPSSRSRGGLGFMAPPSRLDDSGSVGGKTQYSTGVRGSQIDIVRRAPARAAVTQRPGQGWPTVMPRGRRGAARRQRQTVGCTPTRVDQHLREPVRATTLRRSSATNGVAHRQMVCAIPG
jgi:hypothetical protein